MKDIFDLPELYGDMPKKVWLITESNDSNYYPYVSIFKEPVIVMFQDCVKIGGIESKSFMDIGCGYPRIPIIAKHLGFKITKGLECNIEAVDFISRHFKDFMIPGDLLDYNFSEYDVMYSFNPIKDEALMTKGLENILNTMKHGAILYFYRYNIGRQILLDLGFKVLHKNLFKYEKL